MSKFTKHPDLVKGKKNRLKVAQRVRAKQKVVDWHSSHLTWCYGRVPLIPGEYSPGEKELHVEDLDEVLFWATVKLSEKMPEGLVSHYGSHEDGERERKYVFVNFIIKTTIGILTVGTYVEEKDLTLVRKKK